MRWARLADDQWARRGFLAAVAAAIPVWLVIGRNQWFVRDDWGFVLVRERMLNDFGMDEWLLIPQDGHLMAPPIIIYHWLQRIFGIDSYWPYLATLLATHVAIIVLIRVVCRRVGVSEWTNTLLSSMLLVFGSGWENIAFAIQITYNLSLLCFLGHLLLADHDGPVGWRDGVGLLVGFVGITSSGFGPFFIVGIGLVLAARRRWLACAFAVTPLLVFFVWWWSAWGSDVAAESRPSLPTQVPLFVVRGIESTFAGIAGIPSFTGLAVLATVVALVLNLRGSLGHDRWLPGALTLTTLVMLAGIGLQRAGFGLEIASSSRYVYMSAVLLLPAVGLMYDEAIRRLGEPAGWAIRVVLVASAVLNASSLHSRSSEWAKGATDERTRLELLAGVQALDTMLAGDVAPLPLSKDVRVADIPFLVEQRAVVPRAAATPLEQQLLTEMLATPAGG
jgi:hypothetical protein